MRTSDNESHPRYLDPEGWERRIQNWIAHYERLGLRETRQQPPRQPSPDMAAYRRERAARDAMVLAMRRAGQSTTSIAAELNQTRSWVNHAIRRATIRLQQQEAA